MLISTSITSYMSQHNMPAAVVVAQLRAEVEARTKLTMSAGIAPNRMLAKVGQEYEPQRKLTMCQICSDKNKPNGQFELEFERSAITRFIRDLPVR